MRKLLLVLLTLTVLAVAPPAAADPPTAMPFEVTFPSLHVTFGETFRILVVFDDPALGSFERKGTDALHFNLTKSGTEVFTESFHDFSPPDFRVDYYRTFVYANGDVRVDREIIRNPPPPDC